MTLTPRNLLAILTLTAITAAASAALTSTIMTPPAATAGGDTTLLRQIRDNTRQTKQAIERLDLKLVQFCRAVPDTSACPQSF